MIILPNGVARFATESLKACLVIFEDLDEQHISECLLSHQKEW
jgi:hypothetical protein